jgi:Thioredoxin-like
MRFWTHISLLKVPNTVFCVAVFCSGAIAQTVSNGPSAAIPATTVQTAAQTAAPAASAADAPDADAISAKAHMILERGLSVTGLTSKDGKPWHMRADYQIFKPNAPPDSGTVEEWWISPTHFRRTYTTKDVTWTEWSLSTAQQFQSSADFNYETLDLRVGWPLTTPMTQSKNFKPEYPMDWKAVNAGMALNCVMIVAPERYADGIDPDFLFPKLCFDAGYRLRFMGTSDTTVTFNKYQTFQDRAIAYKVDVIVLGVKRSSMDITLLKPLTPEGEAMLKPDEKAVRQPHAWSVVDPRPVPVYQVGANVPLAGLHDRGTVSVPVIIQRDGRVKINGPASLYGPTAQSAIDAIRLWRYQPYLVEGEPVELLTRVSYTFDGNPFVPQTGVKPPSKSGYDPKHNPANDLKEAVATATQAHKRILLEVGGDWCIWCTYLDKFYADHPDLQAFRDSNFITLKVNMSSENGNREFLSQYPRIPGYPHIFVLDADGQLLQSESAEELQKGNIYNVDKVRNFLTQWKPS